MDANGKNQRNLTKHPADDTMAAWSFDGKRIAFISNRDGNWEIYVMNADGSNPTRLTNNDVEDSFPAWSPDNAHIVYASKRDGKYQLFVMDDDGGNQTQLTTDGNNARPAWQPAASKR